MSLLLRGAEVYAPEPLGRKDVLIAGDRIARIAPRIVLTSRSLPGLEVRRLHGLTLVPGFIDAHVHIAGGGGEGGFQHRTSPVQMQALAPHGTTRVVGLLGTDAVTRSIAELLAEARRLTALGLSAFMLTGAYQLPTRTLTGSVRSDLVFIPEVLGAGEIAIADDRGSHPTGRDLLEIASEVRVGALLAGGLLAFALSFDEVIVTLLVAGPQQTLPIWIFNNYLRPNQAPVVSVVALLAILLSVVPVYAASRLSAEATGVPR